MHGDVDTRVQTGASSVRTRLKNRLPIGITAQKLKGKRIRVNAEHGFGDTVTFIKWLAALKQAGVHVIFVCQNALTSALSQSKACFDELYAQRDAGKIGAYDYDVSLMSLPRYVSGHGIVPTRTRDDIPHHSPSVLTVDEMRVQKWIKVLTEYGTRPIGIGWKASKMLFLVAANLIVIAHYM